MKTKICSKCNVEKPLDKFYNNRNREDGKHCYCKDCQRQYLINRKNKPIKCQPQRKIKLAGRHREQRHQCRIDNRIKIAKKNQYWRKNNPEKVHQNLYKSLNIRKGWGMPQPLNEYFNDSHLHHLHLKNDNNTVDHQIAIYIPRQLHHSIYHAYNKPETMIKINLAIMQWYYGLTIKWD